MLIDCEKEGVNGNSYEVVVVGAGAVGLSMGIQLSRMGIKVAILEAGPSEPSSESQKYFEAASSSGRSLPGLHHGRFRALGGTTNFWGGQLVEFDRHIFEKRDWVSDQAWPITRQDIAPYYKQGYDLLGLEQSLTDHEVWEALKVSSPREIEGIESHITRWLPEPNLAEKFKQEIDKNKDLHVYINANVTALVSEDGIRIQGVEVSQLGQSGQVIHAEKVVLANGTVEIVRLLKLNYANGLTPPWANNKWLGVGFFDHLDCIAGFVEPINKKKFSDQFDNVFLSGIKYCPKLRLSCAHQLDEQLLDISGHFIFKNSISENMGNLKIFLKGLARGKLNLTAASSPIKMLTSLGYAMPMVWRYLRYNRMYNLSDEGIMLRLTSEQTPDKGSIISLREDTDAFGVPNVDVRWRYKDDDIHTLCNFAKKVKVFLQENRLAEVTIDERLLNYDVEFMKNIDDANHHMGGARMATDINQGVVDKNMQVFGAKNLFLAGAVVYPTSGFANSTFTAIALGLRLAEHIHACVSQHESVAVA